MAQAVMPETLNDAEMAALEAKHMPETLTDEEMAKHETAPQPQGFAGGFMQGVKELVTPITSNAQGLYSDIDRAAQVGAQRTVEAQNPLTKALAFGGMAARVGGAAVGRTFSALGQEATGMLQKIPGMEYPGVRDWVNRAGYATLPAMQAAAKGYGSLPGWSKDVADIGLNSLMVAPATAAIVPKAANAITGTVSKAGEALGSAGKSMLRSGMKIKDVTAKLASKNVAEGAKAIADDVAKYELQSTTKGFSGISENAQTRIGREMDAADNLIKKAGVDNPGKTIDIDESFLRLDKKFKSGKENTVFGDEENASEMLMNIHKALELRGLTGAQPISKLPEIKQTISQGMGLFKKGKFNIAQDPLKAQVGELAYLQMKNDLEAVVPEIAKHNSAIHDLITVKKAADEAVKRIGNHNKIGLTDWMLLLGGPEVAHTLGAAGLAGLGGIPGAALITKKALGSGRGASAAIGAGKGLQSLSDVLKTDVSTPAAQGLGRLGGTAAAGAAGLTGYATLKAMQNRNKKR